MHDRHAGSARNAPPSAITPAGTCPGHRHWVVTGAAVGLLFAYLAGVLAGVFHRDVTTVDRFGTTAQGTPLLILVAALAGGMATLIHFVPALRAGIAGVLGLLLVTGLSLSALSNGQSTHRTASVWSPLALLEGTGYNPIGVGLVGSALAHAALMVIAGRGPGRSGRDHD